MPFRTCIAAVMLATLMAGLAAHAGEEPRRVLSLDVCTDQMAMLLAAPGQLMSVSFIARDPASSAMAEEAASYRVNHGVAEEIFVMQPDLVLAGMFSARTTVSMLRRLGFRVEEFAPEASFDDVRANFLRMGGVLGQEARAERMVAELDGRLARLAEKTFPGMTAATYAANSYTSGRGSLSDAIIAAAGLRNLGSEHGIVGVGRLPLEMLLLSMPDVLSDDRDGYDAPALAQQNFVHPAYRALLAMTEVAPVPPSWSVCGGPYNLVAAALLQDAADRVGTGSAAPFE